jgi:hypothetical protein
VPQTSFNISSLIARLGLKNIVEMPPRLDIQATIPLGTMYGQVPVHVAGVALIGGYQASVVGEQVMFELQCLDAGGGVLQAVAFDSAVRVYRMIISTTPVVWDTGPVAMDTQQFSNEPTLSVGRSGARIAALTADYPTIINRTCPTPFAPLYVPRGQYIQVQNNIANLDSACTFYWCGISATEGEE